ncbi:MAG: bifunctional adenosylcobinamide kinase/adenosylcobinamide-phosphate guanylyltransferase [Propionibacteriaceae bacterium]|nr:bifunctional adenosylcobinamide kinase/adenosylcobinamide-phosphate guanylyltransferase [Propionibacteriaceae bacterium]
MIGAALVLGGTRSGKSTFAESLLGSAERVTYVATAEQRPDDPEWVERLALHRARRPTHWETVETMDLAAELLSDDPAPMLVDCLGVWLTRLLDDGCWDRDAAALARCGERIDEFVDALGRTSRGVVFVSNEVGLSVVPATRTGRLFTDQLGRLNMRVASAVDRVWLCVAGIPMPVKGA